MTLINNSLAKIKETLNKEGIDFIEKIHNHFYKE